MSEILNGLKSEEARLERELRKGGYRRKTPESKITLRAHLLVAGILFERAENGDEKSKGILADLIDAAQVVDPKTVSEFRNLHKDKK